MLGSRFGPNTKQVERFTELVGELTDDQVSSILSNQGLARSAYGACDTHLLQVSAISQYGNDHEKRLISPACKKLRERTSRQSSIFTMLAEQALMALVLCEVIDPHEFAAWYGPFATEIPIDALGQGLAPQVPPPGNQPFERFVTRVRHVDEWTRIQAVHDMQIGAESRMALHERALAEIQKLLAKLGESPSEYDKLRLAAVTGILSEVSQLGGDRLASTRRLHDMLEGFLGQSGLGDPIDRRAGFETSRLNQWSRMQGFQHCFVDGLLAVAFWAELDPEHSSFLYLPFEAFIPVDSLLFPRGDWPS